MRFVAFVLPLVLALGIPGAALADEPAGPSTASTAAAGEGHSDGAKEARMPAFEIGARVGYALPFGNVAQGVKLDSMADGAIPVAIDVGWRVDRHWLIGAYGSLADLVVASSFCPSAFSCSGTDLRVGVQAQYAFHPAPGVSPWVGVGTGYEWIHASGSQGTASAAVSLQGFEIVNLQGGLDFRVTDGFRVGPVAAFSVGEFQSVSASGTTRDGAAFSGSTAIDHQALHEWLTLGLRGRFDL